MAPGKSCLLLRVSTARTVSLIELLAQVRQGLAQIGKLGGIDVGDPRVDDAGTKFFNP